MGIAWFDAAPPAMEDATLRTGGLPLLGPKQPWPFCEQCGVPMLFRAQIPLALTSLVTPVDDRLLLVFECHAQGDGEGTCKHGEVVVSRGEVTPRQAPASDSFDVVLFDWGPDADRARRLAASLGQDLQEPLDAPPLVVAQGVPRSIAEQALDMLRELQARARLFANAPTVLEDVRGGHLVPFDDGIPELQRTTLPALGQLKAHMEGALMRGLFGGTLPGRGDAATTCGCGKRWRTAVRLMGDESRTLAHVRLPPAIVQLCLDCNRAALCRS